MSVNNVMNGTNCKTVNASYIHYGKFISNLSWWIFIIRGYFIFRRKWHVLFHDYAELRKTIIR